MYGTTLRIFSWVTGPVAGLLIDCLEKYESAFIAVLVFQKTSEPWNPLVPLLVTMLTCAPVKCPSDASYGAVDTFTSCRLSGGGTIPVAPPPCMLGIPSTDCTLCPCRVPTAAALVTCVLASGV